MEEKKQDDNLNVTGAVENNSLTSEVTSTPAEMVVSEVETSATANVVNTDEAASSHFKKNFNLKAYIGGVVAILLIFAGLIFALEKEGRISTGIFTDIISKIEKNQPVAKVNDVAITKGDYQSSYEQLSSMTAAQGADIADAAVMDSLKTQTIDTLVNAELLRQAAVTESLVVDPTAIDNRYNEIRDSLGGQEVLASRMEQFGVTETALRRDIENEILIQQLFDLKIFNSIEVTDEEVQTLYDQAVANGNQLPPLEEIKEAAIVDIRNSKADPLINDYIQSLRNEANIEILI